MSRELDIREVITIPSDVDARNLFDLLSIKKQNADVIVQTNTPPANNGAATPVPTPPSEGGW